MGRITETVKVLLVINILFYVGSLATGMVSYQLFALFFPMNENFQVWQVLTHMFMHDPNSIFHILFNMFMLYMFGSHMEISLGRSKFLFLYFSAGLGATALQILFYYYNFYPGLEALMDAGLTKPEVIEIMKSGQYNTRLLNYVGSEELQNMYNTYNSTAVGASGAIFGLLAAFAVAYPNLPLMIIFIPIPIKAKYLIGGYFALNVISALTGANLAGPENTAYWAHIGGAIIGFITMWYWKKNSFNNRRLY